MSIYITIDGGTSNTRVCLASNDKVWDNRHIRLGAKACIDNKELLCDEIKSAIDSILKSNNLCEADVECILASGMITSEFGLCSLEHIKTPAGIDELHKSMYKTYIEEISTIPFVFIRGVKIQAETYENTDMMRGEETELMGIINPKYRNCVYVLPGSHSKIIKLNTDGKIADFSTTLTGEMISTLSNETILKDAIDLKNSVLDNRFLLKGYDYCKTNGINKALFKVRVLKNVFNESKDKTYSFFMGIVLCDEVEQIINSKCKTVVIGGREQIKNALANLLKNRANLSIITLDEDMVKNSTVFGAIRIFENLDGAKKLCK